LNKKTSGYPVAGHYTSKEKSPAKTEIEKSWLKKNWFALVALIVAASNERRKSIAPMGI